MECVSADCVRLLVKVEPLVAKVLPETSFDFIGWIPDFQLQGEDIAVITFNTWPPQSVSEAPLQHPHSH